MENYIGAASSTHCVLLEKANDYKEKKQAGASREKRRRCISWRLDKMLMALDNL